MAHEFDVSVVDHDCDYAEVCDRHEPDLVLFESGYRSHGSRRIAIRNTGANRAVPRVALHNGDAWCDRRAGLLSDLDAWGIDTVFAISTLFADYLPGLDSFVWPNFVDPALFRDYGLDKSIPVMLTGQRYDLYPWRQAVFPALAAHVPCLTSPQVPYDGKAAGAVLSGEAYARALNASRLVPTCGTVAGEVVRKHFEIPAAAACLVAPRTPGLDAAGFVHLENCVFAEADEVVDVAGHLLAHPDQLAAITRAGHDLVHARHTLRHRPQIRQWFELHRSLRPGERIVQPGPFADLAIAAGPPPRGGVRTAERLALDAGDAALRRCDTAAARARYGEALRYVGYLPEARFGLALAVLADGDPEAAGAILADLVRTTTQTYGAADPDPVEWAYVLVSLICRDRVAEAARMTAYYPRLAHPEIDHVARVLARLAGRPEPAAARMPRHSVHRVPARSSDEFSRWLAAALRAAGRDKLAAAVASGTAATPRHVAEAPWQRLLMRLDGLVRGTRHDPKVPPLPDFAYARRLATQLARAVVPPEARAALRDLRPKPAGGGKRRG